MPEAHTTIPGSLTWGHGCLAACAVLYLAWWWIFFNPNMPKATGVLYLAGVGCIIGAALLGIGAIVLIMAGLGSIAATGSGVALPGWAFAVGGLVAYVVLAFITVRFFQRPVTTELLLFVLWAALELAVVNAVAGAGMPLSGAAVLVVLVVLVLIGCLASYVLYFRLPPMPSFVDGALPLAAVCMFAAIMAAVIKRL